MEEVVRRNRCTVHLLWAYGHEESIELMKQLNYEVNRIGVNINQLVRSYHINGYQTSAEKRRLEEDLKEIRTLHVKICNRLTEMADGNHKTTAP